MWLATVFLNLLPKHPSSGRCISQTVYPPNHFFLPSACKQYVGLSLHIIFQDIQSSQNVHVTFSVWLTNTERPPLWATRRVYTFIITTKLWRKPFHSQEMKKHQESCTPLCAFEAGSWSTFEKEEYESQKIISHLISNCFMFLQEFCQYFTCSGNSQALNILLAPANSQR